MIAHTTVTMRQGRSGFSLIELLVVISIIAMLAALLLPAVQSTRGSARKSQCLNRMRNVAGALQNYASANQSRLPALHVELMDNSTGSTTRKRQPWTVPLLSLLDQSALAADWDTDPKPDHILPVFVCPSDRANAGVPGGLSFVVNCGYGAFTHNCPATCDDYTNDIASMNTPNGGQTTSELTTCDADNTRSASFFGISVNADDAFPQFDWDGNGTLTEHDQLVAQSTGVFWNVPSGKWNPVTLDWIQQSDGVAYTLLLSESVYGRRWANITGIGEDQGGTLVASTQLSTLPTRYLAVIGGKGFGLTTQAFRNAANEYPYPITKLYRAPDPNAPLAFEHIELCNPGYDTACPIPPPPPLTDCRPINFEGGLNWKYNPYSEHLGGVNVVFCDGRGLFLTERIDNRVYALLLSTNGHMYGQDGMTDTTF